MKKLLLLASSLLAFANVYTVYGEETTTTEETTVVENQEDKDPFDPKSYKTVYETDMYKVGTDIPAGVYKLFIAGEWASYTLTGDARGEDLIAIDFVTSFAYVEVKDGQYLELEDCFAVPIDDTWPVKIEDDKLGEGVYRIGFDLEPGEYKVVSVGNYSSYRITADPNGNDYIAASSIKKSSYVEVKDGEYLTLYSAELIVK